MKNSPARLRRYDCGRLWLVVIPAEGVTLRFGAFEAARVYAREVRREYRQGAAGTRTGSS
jgi:hypothetical protein